MWLRVLGAIIILAVIVFLFESDVLDARAFRFLNPARPYTAPEFMAAAGDNYPELTSHRAEYTPEELIATSRNLIFQKFYGEPNSANSNQAPALLAAVEKPPKPKTSSRTAEPRRGVRSPAH